MSKLMDPKELVATANKADKVEVRVDKVAAMNVVNKAKADKREDIVKKDAVEPHLIDKADRMEDIKLDTVNKMLAIKVDTKVDKTQEMVTRVPIRADRRLVMVIKVLHIRANKEEETKEEVLYRTHTPILESIMLKFLKAKERVIKVLVLHLRKSST